MSRGGNVQERLTPEFAVAFYYGL